MRLRRRSDGIRLERLLDQVNATPRALEFVAGQSIGGTGSSTESAVHAFPDDTPGLVTVMGIAVACMKVEMHREQTSKIRLQPIEIENPVRVELRLQSSMNG